MKNERLKDLQKTNDKEAGQYVFYKVDLEDFNAINNIFSLEKPKKVVNLAAQAGVRYSITNSREYIKSNIVGFHNILECSKEYNIEKLLYASSSSVYGGNKKLPFSESDEVGHPINIYAASKRANELMAHSYSHLYNLQSADLRFFTVYGPWGRPDMALFAFTKLIFDKAIEIFNNGNMKRDFTYIDDVIESIFRILKKPIISKNDFDKLNPDPSLSWAPRRIFNIGNSNPTNLMDYINELENAIGITSEKIYLPMQPGDVANMRTLKV